jgi:hypothetical protein
MAPTLSEAPGAYNYVVTAHKPTSATHSVVGNFTHDNELNLIVAYVLLHYFSSTRLRNPSSIDPPPRMFSFDDLVFKGIRRVSRPFHNRTTTYPSTSMTH